MSNWNLKITPLGWWGTFPKPGQATSGVLVETPQGKFLLDCGSGVLSRYFMYGGMGELEGALISHLHYDHMADLGCLQYATNHALRTGIRKEKLRVYAPDTPQVMWQNIQYHFTTTTSIKDGMSFEIAGANVTARKVNHTVECYSFRVERGGYAVVYYTDTTYLPENADFLGNADLLFCEASITEGSRHTIGQGHMSDLEAGQTALDGNVGKLCLFHLPSDGNISAMRERAAQVFHGPVVTPDQQESFLL